MPTCGGRGTRLARCSLPGCASCGQPAGASRTPGWPPPAYAQSILVCPESRVWRVFMTRWGMQIFQSTPSCGRRSRGGCCVPVGGIKWRGGPRSAECREKPAPGRRCWLPARARRFYHVNGRLGVPCPTRLRSTCHTLRNAGKMGLDSCNFTAAPTSKAMDPDASYIKAVPELRTLPAKHCHEPWAAPPAALAATGVELGSRTRKYHLRGKPQQGHHRATGQPVRQEYRDDPGGVGGRAAVRGCCRVRPGGGATRHDVGRPTTASIIACHQAGVPRDEVGSGQHSNRCRRGRRQLAGQVRAGRPDTHTQGQHQAAWHSGAANAAGVRAAGWQLPLVHRPVPALTVFLGLMAGVCCVAWGVVLLRLLASEGLIRLNTQSSSYRAPKRIRASAGAGAGRVQALRKSN